MQPPHEGLGPEQPLLVTEFQARRFEECFAAEADRMTFLRSMSPGEFQEIVSWANYKIRNIPETEQGYLDLNDVDGVVDGSGHHIEYVSPMGSDRLRLMEAGFAAAQQAEDPITAGAILALTIVNTRPLPAANDTTAHLAFTLMSRGYNGSPEDIEHYSKIVRGETGQSIWNTCSIAGLPHRFASAWTYAMAEHYGMTDFVPVDVANYFPRSMEINKLPVGDPRRDIAAMAGEPVLNRAVLTEFVLRAGRDLRDYIIVGPEDSHHGNLYIDAAAVIADVQPHDADLLWSVYRGIKHDYVKSIIDCFEGDTSIHGDWRVILSYFYRLKGDIPPEASILPEQRPGEYDPIIQAVRLVMETMGVVNHTAQED